MCTFLNVFDNCSEKTFWKAAPAEKLGISAIPFSEFFNSLIDSSFTPDDPIINLASLFTRILIFSLTTDAGANSKI